MAESSEKSQVQTTDEDTELNALLESAIEDFDKVAKEDGEEVKKAEDVPKPTPPDSLWAEDFMQNSRNISSLFSPDGAFNMETFGQELQRLAETTSQAAGFDASPDEDFSNIIAQTLRNLSENSNDINSQFSEENLLNMLGLLGGQTGSDDSDPGDFVPFMQKFMQNLLSKDFLQPALVNLDENYPAWLVENKSKLSEEQYAKYEKQHKIVKEIVQDLETERPGDSEDVKKARFDRIIAKMQQIQDCGPPPKELVGEADGFGGLGRPQLPAVGEQCGLQ